MQISNVMLIFLLFSIVFKPIVLGGRGKFLGKIGLREKPALSQTMYQNTEKSCFQRKPQQILVLYVILPGSYYNYEYVENIKTGINFLNKRQIR